MEANQIDPVAAAVLGHFEEVEDAEKPGFASQGRRDIGQPDGLDRIHLDFAFLHPVAATDFDVRPRPDTDGASDLSSADSLPETLGKEHGERRVLFACLGRRRAGDLHRLVRPVGSRIGEEQVVSGRTARYDDMKIVGTLHNRYAATGFQVVEENLCPIRPDSTVGDRRADEVRFRTLAERDLVGELLEGYAGLLVAVIAAFVSFESQKPGATPA